MDQVGFGPRLQPGGKLRQRPRCLSLQLLRDPHLSRIAFPPGGQSRGIPLVWGQCFRHDRHCPL